MLSPPAAGKHARNVLLHGTFFCKLPGAEARRDGFGYGTVHCRHNLMLLHPVRTGQTVHG